MICKFCEEFRAEFFATLYRLNEEWETKHSNELDVWDDEDPSNLKLIERAKSYRGQRPVEAVDLYVQAAQSGSTKAEHILAWYFHTGTGVEKSLARAKEHYRNAHLGGSQLASIQYASTCFHLEEFDECFDVLRRVAADEFAPAHYHLAWYRHRHLRNRNLEPEELSHLEIAANAGHPLAKFWLGKAMLKGTLGLTKIPHGIKMSWHVLRMVRQEM